MDDEKNKGQGKATRQGTSGRKEHRSHPDVIKFPTGGQEPQALKEEWRAWEQQTRSLLEEIGTPPEDIEAVIAIRKISAKNPKLGEIMVHMLTKNIVTPEGDMKNAFADELANRLGVQLPEQNKPVSKGWTDSESNRQLKAKSDEPDLPDR